MIAGIVNGTSTLARSACAISYVLSVVLIAESTASLVISQRILNAETPPMLDGDDRVNHLRELVYRMTLDEQRHRQISSIGLILGGVLLIALMLAMHANDDALIVLTTLGAILGVIVATHRLVTTARARTSQQTMRKEQHDVGEHSQST